MPLAPPTGLNDAFAVPALVGVLVTIRSPSMTVHCTGTVLAVDGAILTVRVSPELLVVADVEDCSLLVDSGCKGA